MKTLYVFTFICLLCSYSECSTFGVTDKRGTANTTANGIIYCSSATLYDNGAQVTKITLFIKNNFGSTDTHYKAAIYTSSAIGTRPGTLVVGSDEVTVTAAYNNWIDFTVSTTLGQGKYYLAWWSSDAAGSDNFYYDDNINGYQYNRVVKAYGSFPAEYGTPSLVVEKRIISIYATYTTGTPPAAGSKRRVPYARGFIIE